MKKIMMFLVLTAGMCMALSDGYDVVALWHLDSTFESGTELLSPDDDSVLVGRGADLKLMNVTDLVSPGYDGTGSALGLNGVDQFAYFPPWGLYDNIKVEMAFKADSLVTTANKYFVEIAGIVRIYLNVNGMLTMTIWDDSGTATTKNVATAVTTGQWYTFEASYESDGLFSLKVWEYPSGNLVGSKQGIYGTGKLSKNGTPAIVIGSYRTAGNQPFHGTLDEIRISNLQIPEFTDPYADLAGTVQGLWHFDAFADPNVSGSVYELLPDDDADNIGRDADMYLYGNGTRVNAGENNGPRLVDPDAAGAGYPADNAEFGKSAYFSDPVLVEADDFRVAMSKVPVDPRNVRFELWFKPDDELLTISDDVTTYLLGRWNQVVVRFMKTVAGTGGSWEINVITWDENNEVRYLKCNYDAKGMNPSSWTHMAVENYYGQLKLIVNGSVAHAVQMDVEGLGEPSRDTMFVGRSYKSTGQFWGYLDELKISQAVYDVDCGAWGYLPGDLNEDCIVDIGDLKILAEQWLSTSDPTDPEAIDGEISQYENYNIPFATVTPTIDGTLSSGEWDDATSIFLGMPELTTAPNIGIFTPIPGSEEYPTHQNNSAEYSFKWDNDQYCSAPFLLARLGRHNYLIF